MRKFVEQEIQLPHGVRIGLATEEDIPEILAVHRELFIATYSNLPGLSKQIITEHITS